MHEVYEMLKERLPESSHETLRGGFEDLFSVWNEARQQRRLDADNQRCSRPGTPRDIIL